jgi:DNA repair protein SbcD/Mre11
VARVIVVHAADLHLDSPMRGLERYEGAPLDLMRGATRQALENLVELCCSEGAALLLLAGDLYDGDWRDYSTGLFFARQMSALREAGTKVVLVRGNHDAASVVRKHLQLPDNVRELRSRAPETVIFEELGVAVHGQSYGKPAISDDLAARYPEARFGLVNFGLLHTCATGRAGHLPYAPCRLETLLDKGYDYWALGHVHQREVLHREPWVVFSGNLQGRHVRETGPKGATVVRVEEGRIVEVSERILDAARWVKLEVDVSAAHDGFDVVDCVRAALEEAFREGGERPLAARIVLEGRSAAHGSLLADPAWLARLHAEANDVGRTWLERVVVATRPSFDREALAGREDALGQVARALVRLPDDDRALEALARELADSAPKLPRELHGELALDSPAAVRALLEEVGDLVLDRLMAKGT